MDVVGATFRAAGGSVPELFVSLIATLQESDVGFAAIVGSAVSTYFCHCCACHLC